MPPQFNTQVPTNHAFFAGRVPRCESGRATRKQHVKKYGPIGRTTPASSPIGLYDRPKPRAAIIHNPLRPRGLADSALWPCNRRALFLRIVFLAVPPLSAGRPRPQTAIAGGASSMPLRHMGRQSPQHHHGPAVSLSTRRRRIGLQEAQRHRPGIVGTSRAVRTTAKIGRRIATVGSAGSSCGNAGRSYGPDRVTDRPPARAGKP